MSGRELVILLLGLAIVAVVLRGLYVALNARRGQIKLAIDKNIPQNVDLEALELAELPGGGARVVTRSLEEVNRQNSALDMAESKSKSMNLANDGGESYIPVLMDAVELSETTEINAEAATPNQAPLQSDSMEETETADQAFTTLDGVSSEFSSEEVAQQIEEVDEDEFTSYVGQTPSIGEDWETLEEPEEMAEDEVVAPAVTGDETSEQYVEDADEDPDSILFDYDEDEADADERDNQIDSMSSVAPDYDDDDEEEDEESLEEGEESFAELSDDRSHFEEDFVEEPDAEEHDEYAEKTEQAQIDEEQQTFDAGTDIDKFSMTAGERIGGNPPAIGEIKQSGLFDDVEDEAADELNKPKKSRSLFSMFGRKSGQRHENKERADEIVATPAETDSELDESEEAKHADEMPATINEQTTIPEIEIVSELDQKRAATVDLEPEAERLQPEEFEHSEVLVLNVTAKEGRVFAGDDLLHILIMSGLKFGDMNIFHKRLSKDNQGAVIFSVANMLNPGTFDLNNMDEFTTLGISFFLALPTPMNNLDAFEQMLAVAQDIRDTLGGDLKDDHRNGMTAQTIEHYRQRIRDFELRRLKAVAARG